MANETSTKAEGETLAEMKRSSQELKQRIEELRRKTEMPVNASLGNPQIDAENADGRNDLPDGDDV
jgi:hypothetical protein